MVGFEIINSTLRYAMKPLYGDNEYCQARGKDLLPFECYGCGGKFFQTKTKIKYGTKIGRSIKYCNQKCRGKYLSKAITDKCGFCGMECTRQFNEYKASKSGKIFCNHSCAAKYNNTHKTTGYRRSKIEIWIEEQLKVLYPNLNILFNDKTAINSELDIYLPSKSLAFELNGIFHYEPIYGTDKLKQIQSNDQNKFYLCQQNKINLCIIDISSIIHIKPDKAQKFLNIICTIISDHLK